VIVVARRQSSSSTANRQFSTAEKKAAVPGMSWVLRSIQQKFVQLAQVGHDDAPPLGLLLTAVVLSAAVQ
jgi:hypothetical protein